MLGNVYKSLVLAVICFLFFINSSNHAKLIPYFGTYEKKFLYTFQIGDKLVGNGEMLLTIKKNKIEGTAIGLGMTSNCNVELCSMINGIIDLNKGKIDVNIIGEGDPTGIILPGKINFHGPLKGFLQHKKFNLTGKVNINGRLASLAGFKKSEKLQVIISDPSLLIALKNI